MISQRCHTEVCSQSNESRRYGPNLARVLISVLSAHDGIAPGNSILGGGACDSSETLLDSHEVPILWRTRDPVRQNPEEP